MISACLLVYEDDYPARVLAVCSHVGPIELAHFEGYVRVELLDVNAYADAEQTLRERQDAWHATHDVDDCYEF